MEKQRIDEKQGKTYGSGVVLESYSIPEFVKEAEERKKELLVFNARSMVASSKDIRRQKQKNVSVTV